MVKVITTTEELIDHRKTIDNDIGFVPTMGNLHAGHLSLIEAALKEFQVVYLSIFVNPKQFGPTEDFKRYPRTLKDDINLIEELLKQFPNAQIIVYAPNDPKEVFPEDSHSVSVKGLSEILEGDIRPGHFEGVTTVVQRLFELIRPTKAYFGLKDYQQFVVIKQMVKDLNLSIKLEGLPIIREKNGLALSSRNQFLSSDQKESALVLSRSLKEVASSLNQSRSNLDLTQLKIKEIIQDKNWNYLEIRDASTLSSDISVSEEVTILGVYQLGVIRLLDNVQMEIK